MKAFGKFTLLSAIAVAGVLYMQAPAANATASVGFTAAASATTSLDVPAGYYYHGHPYAYRYRGMYFNHRYYRGGRYRYY